MQIPVNGEAREVPEGATVTRLLAELGLASERVAVERNRALVPRVEHETTLLEPGDRLEIVTLVGGG
jgi:thiamine biosynthesis protein ThiS